LIRALERSAEALAFTLAGKLRCYFPRALTWAIRIIDANPRAPGSRRQHELPSTMPEVCSDSGCTLLSVSRVAPGFNINHF
jgi:hypothetical protein